MSITKVTRNYQITVPRDIREQAKIAEGDKLVVTIENNEIKMKKFDEDSFKKAFGIWKDAGINDSIKYVRELRKEWESRAKRIGLR